MTKGFAPVPSLPLFLDFCAAKVVGALPQALRQPQRDAVLHLEPAEDGKGGLAAFNFHNKCSAHQLDNHRTLLTQPGCRGSHEGEVTFATHGCCCRMSGREASDVQRQAVTAPCCPVAHLLLPLPHPSAVHAARAHAGCRVHLAGGRVLAARAVIYTPANRQPVLPAWARHLLIEGDEAAAAAAGGAGVAAAGGPATEQAAERAQQAQRLPPGWATADQVDLRGAELADLSGRSVVVVGGGMSAGLLAAGAAERGADVVLVCHRWVAAVWGGPACLRRAVDTSRRSWADHGHVGTASAAHEGAKLFCSCFVHQ